MGKGFNLPDLDKVTKFPSLDDFKKDTPAKPAVEEHSDGISANRSNDEYSATNNESTATPQNTDDSNILSQDLNIDNIQLPDSEPDNQDDEDIEDLPEFTDEDIEEDDSPSFAEMAFGSGDNTATVKGVVEDVQIGEDEIMFVMKKSGQGTGVFYLRKPITNGNMDSILRQATKGVPMEVLYDKNDVESTDDNVPVYTIKDLVNIDLDKALVSPEQSPAPQQDDEQVHVQKKSSKQRPPRKKKSSGKPLKRLIKINNSIGDAIYKFLAKPFGLFTKIPFAGKILGRSNILWKYVCRAWLIIIILLFGLFTVKHLSSKPSSEYDLSASNIKIQLNDPNYDSKTNTVTAIVKNNSNIYAYYYINATVVKKGVIPFTKKTISCTGPSIGQSIGNSQKMTFKCSGEKLSKVSSYVFDINSDNK